MIDWLCSACFNKCKKKREAPATNSSHHDYELVVLLVTFMF